MEFGPIGAAIYSEGVLSLYPILIKTVPTNLFTQWLARFMVFPVMAFLLGGPSDTKQSKGITLGITLGMGLLNVVHVGASYLSYQLLPVGVALSLFYLYPVWNVLAGALLFGESVSFVSVALLGVALVGVYFLLRQPPSENTPPSKEVPDTSSLSRWGIIAALVASLTETMIYAFVRWNHVARVSPWYTIRQLYPVGLALLVSYAVLRPAVVDTTPQNWFLLLAFNAVFGVSGYVARFHAIPKLPTLVYSLLCLLGVTFGHVWGGWFAKESPSWSVLGGSALIALSAAAMRYTSTSFAG